MNSQKILKDFSESAAHLEQQLTAFEAALGRLVVVHNNVQMNIGDAIAGLLGIPDIPDGRIVSAAMSYGQLTDLLLALLIHRSPGEGFNQQAKKLATALRKFDEYRNKMLHSFWGTKSLGSLPVGRMKSSVKGGKGYKNNEDFKITPREILDECEKGMGLFIELVRVTSPVSVPINERYKRRRESATR